MRSFLSHGNFPCKEAKDQLFAGNVKLILCTGGAKGAQAFTRSESAYAPGVRVKAIDTTGAGDAL
ncbi:MAG: PfkB family carbohydrate kinase [Lachnospiraceae bacterium]